MVCVWLIVSNGFGPLGSTIVSDRRIACAHAQSIKLYQDTNRSFARFEDCGKAAIVVTARNTTDKCGTFMKELMLHAAVSSQAEAVVSAHTAAFHNHRWRHPSLGSLSPAACEHLWQ